VRFRYAECQGNGPLQRWIDPTNAPANGSSHNYQVDLDTNSGTWKYGFDATEWYFFKNEFWKNKVAGQPSWSGEIFNLQDDMPGTATNKCTFTSCQFRQSGGNYVDAGLTAASLFSNNFHAWGAELVSATAFNIWDKHPRP